MKKAFGVFWIFCATVTMLSSAVAFHPGVAWGENLMQVYQAAIKNDPQFKGAGYERLAEQESLKQAYAAFWPTISVNANATETNQQIVNSENAVFVNGTSNYLSTTFGPTLTLPLFRYPLLVQLRQAKQKSKQADVKFEIARDDLILRVAKAYVAAQTASDNIAYLQEEKKDVDASLANAQLRYRSGLAPNTDLYDAQAHQAAVEADLAKAKNERHDALEALAAMTGSPVQLVRRFKEDVPLTMPNPPSLKEWTTAGLAQNLQMKNQQCNTKIARDEVSREKAARLPVVNLVGQFNQNDMGGSLYGGGATVDNASVAVNVSVPLFEGFGMESKLRQARDRYHGSLEMLEQQKRNVVLEVSAYYSGIKTAISRAEALKTSIYTQTQVYDAKERGYKSGVYPALAVLDAARDLYLFRRDFSLTRYDYIMNTLKLKAAAGTLSEQDLIVLNGWLKQ